MLGISNFAKKVFGTKNNRQIKSVKPIIDKINSLEDSLKTLSDDKLKEKTSEFRNRVSNGESLEVLLPEAFAVVREASIRTIGLRPFDVQLMGGIFLHRGYIAEMKTGEGKTLTATLPVYLNSLVGKIDLVTLSSSD